MLVYLFLPELPYPPHSGGRIVAWSVVTALVQSGFDVHLFSFTHDRQDEAEGVVRLEGLGVHVNLVQGVRRIDWRSLGSAAFSSAPYKVHRFNRPELAAMAAESAHRHPPDIIHCQNYYMSGYARHLKVWHCRILYDDNFEPLVLDRWRQQTSSPALKALIGMEARRVRRYLGQATEWLDRIAAISTVDHERFTRILPQEWLAADPNRLTVLPPAMPMVPGAAQDSSPNPNPFGEEDSFKNIVFTGTFNYPPNIEGAEWLVERVLPLLPENARLWLVGRSPDMRVQSLADPKRVFVTGAVENTAAYLDHADLAVVPLSIGSGIRLKILEALSAGCPVVSTHVGCEGLANKAEDACWEIAQDPEPFARAIEKTLADPPDAATLRHWVQDRHSMAAFKQKLLSLYQL